MDNTVIIPGGTIFAMVCSLLLSAGIPIGLIIYFSVKRKFKLKPCLLGAAVFVVFVLVLESLMHQAVIPLIENVWIYCLYGAFAAGIFEETGRLLVGKFLLKGKTGNTEAVSYGIGHGGIEAILLVGVTYVINIVFVVMVNTGAVDAGDPALAETIEALLGTSTWLFLLGGVERVFAVIIQISLSVMVFKGIREKKIRFYLFAILCHAGIDFFAVMSQQDMLSIQVVEVMMFLVSILGVVFLVREFRISPMERTDAPAMEYIPAAAEETGEAAEPLIKR